MSVKSLSGVPESRQQEIFPDAPVTGETVCATKLIRSIDEIAVVCADICRLHELTVGPHTTWPEWDESNVSIPDRLWFKQVILDHIKRSRERDLKEQWCSSSGRITLIEERHYSPDKVSGYRISFDIGYVSATEAEKLISKESKQ